MEFALYLFTILAEILDYIIIVICLRKRADLQLGFCKKCRGRPLVVALIWMAVAAGTIMLTVHGVMAEDLTLVFVGLGLLILNLILWVLTTRTLVPQMIDDRWIHVGGAGKE